MQHIANPNYKIVNDINSLTVQSPAKLILSGEHAVVYGHPALAIAINRYTTTTIKWSTPLHFSFHLSGLDFRQKVTLEALKRLKRKLNKQYQKFDSGDISIREVIKHPFELTLYSAISVLEKIKHKLPMGLSIHTESDIPMGCGMGSSAASVVSTIYAISHFLKIDFGLDDYIRLGIESENLQHGYSSGLDVNIVYHGGCMRYQPGQFEKINLPNLPLQLINTGKPGSTTGECVSFVAKHFIEHHIGPKFAETTNQLQKALSENNLSAVKNAIKQNHRLLVEIGVVPKTVQQFIADVEMRGCAAKICGAGSISGEHAGAVIVVGDETIQDLITQYNFSQSTIEIDQRGTCVI